MLSANFAGDAPCNKPTIQLFGTKCFRAICLWPNRKFDTFAVAKRRRMYYNNHMQTIFSTKSSDETEKLAEEFARTLVAGDVVLLNGDLGAGKTHFAKGLARGLGVCDVVTSPTFALHNSYRGSSLMFNHFDFYRVESAQEVEMLGLHEFFCDKSGVCAIEWSENVRELLPAKSIVVNIETVSDNARKITIER